MDVGYVMQEGQGADGVIAVSKGVIQRDHQHAATITGEKLFQPPNPFNRMTEDDVDSCKVNVEKQSQSDSGWFNVLLTDVWWLANEIRHVLLTLFSFIYSLFPYLCLATSEIYYYSGGRGILTELSLCYNIVYHCSDAQWYKQFLQVGSRLRWSILT